MNEPFLLLRLVDISTDIFISQQNRMRKEEGYCLWSVQTRYLLPHMLLLLETKEQQATTLHTTSHITLYITQ